MAKQRKYNTAVIATDKNGNKFKYKSLEEASEKTGLSVRTIKSRAVNSGKTGKDKLIFEAGAKQTYFVNSGAVKTQVNFSAIFKL